MHDLDDVARRTRALMDALGRDHLGRPLAALGWTFAFDRARTRLGLCAFRRGGAGGKTISLSRPLAARLGWAVMEDVARHEVAHALDYETRGRSGHDAAWKAWARRCGADPSATYEGPLGDDPAAPLVGTCPSGCGYARPFFRVPARTYLCAPCLTAGHRRPLVVTERATGRPVARAGPRWVGTCPRCAAAVGFARRPSGRRACAACCRTHAGGRFDARFELALARTAPAAPGTRRPDPPRR